MAKRPQIHALVVYSRIFYFVDRGAQRGASYEALKFLERYVNETRRIGDVPIRVLFYAAAAGQIRPLVSTADGLTRWWAADVVVQRGRATLVELGFFGRSTLCRLRAVSAMAPERMRRRCETGKEWAGTSISFELVSTNRGTTLRFSHGGWRRATD